MTTKHACKLAITTIVKPARGWLRSLVADDRQDQVLGRHPWPARDICPWWGRRRCWRQL